MLVCSDALVHVFSCAELLTEALELLPHAYAHQLHLFFLGEADEVENFVDVGLFWIAVLQCVFELVVHLRAELLFKQGRQYQTALL